MPESGIKKKVGSEGESCAPSFPELLDIRKWEQSQYDGKMRGLEQGLEKQKVSNGFLLISWDFCYGDCFVIWTLIKILIFSQRGEGFSSASYLKILFKWSLYKHRRLANFQNFKITLNTFSKLLAIECPISILPCLGLIKFTSLGFFSDQGALRGI